MLISHTKHFIYTKTVKTAGTSVESYFERYCMPDNAWEFSHAREEYVSETGIIGYRGKDIKGKNWYNHMPAYEIRDKIGRHTWDKYFKFCVVRNPFDKLVSAFYFFEHQRKNRKTTHNLKFRIKQMFEKAKPIDYVKGESSGERFRSWIINGGSIIDRDKYMINNELCIDYFIKYEDLEKGIKHVCNLLKIPFEPERIPKLKIGIRDKTLKLSDYYNDKTIKIVSDTYSFELETFGYKPPV